jgi:hypothetical protein
MKRECRIKITNDFKSPKTLWIEPWAVDYGMMPDDEFEIIAEDPKPGFCFRVSIAEDALIVYIEGAGMRYPIVCQNGKELEFGHQSLVRDQ